MIERDSSGHRLRPMTQQQWNDLAAELALLDDDVAEEVQEVEPMSPEEEEAQGAPNWWETAYEPNDYDPREDPWATPDSWELTTERPQRKGTSCGRCGSENIDDEFEKHVSWECTAQEAWIEAAINDRRARPDRYRQALKDKAAAARLF